MSQFGWDEQIAFYKIVRAATLRDSCGTARRGAASRDPPGTDDSRYPGSLAPGAAAMPWAVF